MIAFICLFLILNVCSIDAYTILVFSPTVSKSHLLENGRIADALARDGHNVTVLEVYYYIEPGQLKTTSVAKNWPVTFDVPGRLDGLGQLDVLADGLFLDFWEAFRFHSFSNRINFAFFDQRKDVIEQLRAEKFDVIFYEQYTWLPIVLAEILNIKTRVFVSSCPLIEHQAVLTGVPLELSYVPVAFGPYTDEMTIKDRFYNMAQGLSFLLTCYYDWNYNVKQGLEERFGKDFPMPWEIAKKADLLVINTDEFIEYPRPLPPNVIHIGGLGMDHHFNLELTSPYKEVMEKGKKGVVFFSLGSIVETNKLPEAYMRNVFDTIKKYGDYYFIVKISTNDDYSKGLAKEIKNVYITDWAPQPQILAHPRLQLFVTHGGYNSILEVAYNAVPVLGIGMRWDQLRNVKVVERNGWGLSLNKHSLKYSASEFEEKLHDLLTVKKYKDNALRIQHILNTKPQTGEQRLLSYIKFLEQNDGKLPELQSIAPHMSFVTYNNLDIFFYIILAIAGTITIVIIVLKKLANFPITSLCSTKKQKTA